VTTIMLEIPEELKAIVPALCGVVDVIKTQAERGRSGGSVDYAAFERQLSQKVAEVERRGHEVALTALDVDAPQVMINKALYTRVLRSEASFMGFAGPSRVLRSLYRPVGQRNAPTVDLVALRAGAVAGGWLPATAREMAFEVQQRTSREAEASGQRLGRLPYSHASFEQVAHAVGEMYVKQHQQIEQTLIEAFVVPEQTHNVSVSLDRVSVPMEEPRELTAQERSGKDAPQHPIARVYRMAFCGTLTLHDADGEPIYTIRYGTMPDGDPQGLCEGMADDVVQMLAQRPDLKVVLLCDGAPEMWNKLDAQFTKPPFDVRQVIVSRLIDFWHAIEKLAAAAKVMADNEPAKTLIARWKLLLGNTSAARLTILGELIASGKEDIEYGESKPVHEAITYLTNNAERMDYAAARRKGLPIGSGGVEATCKSLINVRMKRSGSRWKNRTGEHVVHLRALALSDRWDAAMDMVLKRPRVLIRAMAA
jgi:hypothetical protein